MILNPFVILSWDTRTTEPEQKGVFKKGDKVRIVANQAMMRKIGLDIIEVPPNSFLVGEALRGFAGVVHSTISVSKEEAENLTYNWRLDEIYEFAVIVVFAVFGDGEQQEEKHIALFFPNVEPWASQCLEKI